MLNSIYPMTLEYLETLFWARKAQDTAIYMHLCYEGHYIMLLSM